MNIIVVLGGLVTGTAGTVESRACVDARSSNVATVLARDGIASTAGGCWVGQGDGSRGEEGGQGGELHDEYSFFMINDWIKTRVDLIIFGFGLGYCSI
jgi:hypothetical protein